MDSMFYKSTSSLETLKADLISAHSEWTEAYGDFTAKVNKMTKEWTGEASEEFQKKYDTKEKIAMDDVETVLKSVEDAIATVKERITAAEAKNKAIAQG